MEEGRLTYFDMAENDYSYLRHDFESGRVGNLICYASQSICERYLKHAVSIGCREKDTTRVLRTHSLKTLVAFIEENIPDFTCEWNSILLADGYYFSARYPGGMHCL